MMQPDVKEYIEMSIARRFDSMSMRLDRIQESIDHYSSGFPGDDPTGHRIYHESLIEKNKAYADLGRKLLFELTKWGLIGFLGWLAIAGWHDIVSTIRGSK